MGGRGQVHLLGQILEHLADESKVRILISFEFLQSFLTELSQEVHFVGEEARVVQE